MSWANTPVDASRIPAVPAVEGGTETIIASPGVGIRTSSVLPVETKPAVVGSQSTFVDMRSLPNTAGQYNHMNCSC